MPDNRTSEAAFETVIEAHLLAHGYVPVDCARYLPASGAGLHPRARSSRLKNPFSSQTLETALKQYRDPRKPIFEFAWLAAEAYRRLRPLAS